LFVGQIDCIAVFSTQLMTVSVQWLTAQYL